MHTFALNIPKVMSSPVDKRLKPWFIGALFALFFSLGIFEWHYGGAGDSIVFPVLLTYPAYLIGPVFISVWFYIYSKKLPIGVEIRQVQTILFCIVCLLFFLLGAQTLLPLTSRGEFNRFNLIQIIMMPAWFIFGMRSAVSFENAHWMLDRLALVLALTSLLSFLLGIVGYTDPLSYVCSASGPMRLAWLFGFFWFLSWWLASSSFINRYFWGLAASSLGVVVTLHKPIIFSVMCGTLCLIFLNLWAGRISKQFKFVQLVGLAAFGFYIADLFSGGILSDSVVTWFFEKVIKQSSFSIDSLASAEFYSKGSSTRFILWGKAIEIFQQSPWIGSGFASVDMSEEGSLSLHNGYLDILLAFGMLGALPIFLFIIGWFYVIVRNSVRDPALFTMQAGCVAYVFSLVGFNSGGTLRLFRDACYLLMLVAGIAFRIAMDSKRKQPLP